MHTYSTTQHFIMPVSCSYFHLSYKPCFSHRETWIHRPDEGQVQHRRMISSKDITTHTRSFCLQVALDSLRDRKENTGGFFPQQEKKIRVWKPKLFCLQVMDPSFPDIYSLYNSSAVLLYLFPIQVRDLKMISGRSCAHYIRKQKFLSNVLIIFLVLFCSWSLRVLILVLEVQYC